ncbi:histidinol-phosphate transaminase [Treponema primitia ZAS-2]|uniref:Histidinol-phosphate aminotransferase n=1 Tax=Treponema primitia (strain ATCC BAA-887 / DSM 12427 / ZAS-2) TaxID=545694 RepID=F5YL08_TREPZ|nr:histidinol-phosphate transaminase [Treponema primitia]AEF86043.1 histidinol-phosphate transaminase [Treponema primitia ZAS-2]
MSSYWNQRTQKLSPYIPGEQPRDGEFIKLNTNENPYPPSPKVIEAIKAAAADTMRLYPDPVCGELREAIAGRYGVTPEQVFVGNGSDEVLAFAFGAFFDQDILFPDITYSFYPVYAGLWDISFRSIPVSDDFSINYKDYLIPNGGIIFPNPNAPTGRSLPLEDIFAIASYQEKLGKVLIVDEAYAAFAAGRVSAVSSGGRHNLLTVHTLSKAFSLAGLRVGFAIGSEELIEGLNRVKDSFNSYTLDRLAQAGAAAAIRDSDYYEGITAKVIATRERVVATLIAQGFTVIPSEANFLFIQAPGKPGPEFLVALRERGILVRHFNKPRIADYLRVSIGTDEEMDAFLAACGEIGK